MTDVELNREHEYRRIERLGHLCGTDVPTVEQHRIARDEGDCAITALKAQEEKQIDLNLKCQA